LNLKHYQFYQILSLISKMFNISFVTGSMGTPHILINVGKSYLLQLK
jgi:hypothetical protein